ncbi:hypothetical protein B0I37DRAFT_409760 [Chaetomium sp. MPI-CAGE-AT-0009]|nr:hypothetical protein B0I37DRAFT_409760 [Chaetomium sp. MPI-CAGE-AT-0009]
MHNLDDGGSIFEGGNNIITTWLRPPRAPKQPDTGGKLQSRAFRPHHALLVGRGRALWPETLDGTESLPPLTTSTTCGSCRESILGDMPALKPEPVTSAERLALNSLCIDDSILGPDVERILNDLEPLDLDDLVVSMDKLVDEFPALALHMEKRTGEVPAFCLRDQIPDTNPKVLPWLASVERPEGPPFVSGEFVEARFSSRTDEFSGTGHPEQAVPRHAQTTKVTRGLGHLQLTEFGKVDPPTCCSTSEPDSIDKRSSLVSTTDYLDEDNITSIGSYAVERLFGPGIEDTLHWTRVEEVVENFIDELLALKHGTEATSLQLTSLSGGTDTQGDGSFGSSSGQSSLKRKASGGGGGGSRAQRPRKDDEGGDDEDTSRRNGGGDGPLGNGKPSESGRSRRLEFMCPYRLKDPIRFNVRAWYDCATKAYICEEAGSKRNELNELRPAMSQESNPSGDTPISKGPIPELDWLSTDYFIDMPPSLSLSEMAAMPKEWPDDPLAEFDALLAGIAIPPYPVTEVGKEALDPPPMMPELGYEEGLMALEHMDYQWAPG